MNETEIRDRLVDLAADAPKGFTAPPQLLRRARRRVVLTLASSVVIALVLFGAGIAGFRALGSVDRQPAVEPPVGTSEDLFADVHGWIAYRSGQEVVAVDPGNPRDTVALRPSHGADPIGWSPDGTRLLLSSDLDRETGYTYGDLFVVHADGSNTHLVPGLFVHANGSSVHYGSGGGSFSPDGNSITYAMGGDRGGVYVMDADGGSRRLVAEADSPGPCGQFAAWSPDGSRIAFIDFQGPYGPTCHRSPYGVSFVNADGAGLREQLVHLPLGLGAGGLVWSPDGSQLAFWGDFETLHHHVRPAQVFVINADGSGLRQITHDGDNRWPTWSPDGSRLAFVHDGALNTMAPDGTDVQRVEGVSPEGAIAWNPVR
jgi:dipeptidyl aminopeptidase/acylaminoacyl peptidase